jgi:hypothetical protein
LPGLNAGLAAESVAFRLTLARPIRQGLGWLTARTREKNHRDVLVKRK